MHCAKKPTENILSAGFVQSETVFSQIFLLWLAMAQFRVVYLVFTHEEHL